jgi:hypothetical protein
VATGEDQPEAVVWHGTFLVEVGLVACVQEHGLRVTVVA